MSKRGENIYKRKDNRWEARYIQSYRPDGTAKYGYCYGKTYREAKQKTAAAKAALLTNRLSAAAAGGRFAKYCDEWLLLKRSCVKESTYVKYISVLEKHIKPGLGGCPVQNLSSVLVEQFGHELLCGKGLSAKTVRDTLTILHSVLRYTAKQCPEIAARVDVVYPKSVKKEMRVLSRGEQDRLVQYLLSDMDECKFGVLLSLLTGLRIGEVCAMRWEDISLQERAIYVSGTMQRLKSLENAQGKKTKIINRTEVLRLRAGHPAERLCARAVPAAFHGRPRGVRPDRRGRTVRRAAHDAEQAETVRGGMRAFRGPLSRAAPHVRHQMRRGGI